MDTPTPSPAPSAPQKSNKTLIVIVVIVILLALLGWAGQMMTAKMTSFTGEKLAEKLLERAGGPGTDVDINGDSVQVKMKDGSGSVEVGNASLPDSWPKDVPVYAGAKIQYSGSQADGNQGVIAMSMDAPEKILAYYKETLMKDGWKNTQSVSTGAANAMQFEKDGRAISVSIISSDGGSMITLGVMKQ
jgi:hypothetical protein